jgi:ribosomal protein L15
MDNKIVCRKCQGNHLTIKCGKEESKLDKLTEIKPEENEKKIYIQRNSYDRENKQPYDKPYDRENKQPYDRENKEHKPYRKFGKVKMTNLPPDVTQEEMLELTYDWGMIARLTTVNHDENSNVYIDFKSEDMADYFVKALDRTPFEYRILSVERIYE